MGVLNLISQEKIICYAYHDVCKKTDAKVKREIARKIKNEK